MRRIHPMAAFGFNNLLFYGTIAATCFYTIAHDYPILNRDGVVCTVYRPSTAGSGEHRPKLGGSVSTILFNFHSTLRGGVIDVREVNRYTDRLLRFCGTRDIKEVSSW